MLPWGDFYMKWSMIQLQKYRKTGIEFDETVQFDHLKERDNQIRAISPIHIEGKADPDSKKVTFYLHITGELVLPSSRTLRDVRFPLDIHSTETFVYKSMDEQDDGETENVHFIEGEMINLQPVIEELILLEIPIQVYNEADDQIPAEQESGKGWTFIQWEDRGKEKKVDPRLADLAKFFHQQDDDK